MSEEVTQTFGKCLVKKSMHHYKELIISLGSVVLVLAVFALALFIIFCIEHITTTVAAYFAVYIIFVCVFAAIIMESLTLKNFLRGIVNVHIIIIEIVSLIVLMVSCYVGIALCVSVLMVLISERYFMLESGWRFVLLCISLFILCPLNFSAGECLKCDTVVHPLVDKLHSYELR